LAVSTLIECETAILIINEKQKDTESDPLVHLYTDELKSVSKELYLIIEEANRNFYRIYGVQIEIVELFYQMKVLEIEDRYQTIMRMTKREYQDKEHELFLTYIEYSYVEISYLTEMREANLEAERKILKKHKKYSRKKLPTPAPNHDKITRMTRIEESYANKIEDLYVEERMNKNMESKDSREYLRKTAHKDESNEQEYFYMGVGVGASVVVLGILVFIIWYQGFSV
jgi:hypothetical protein